MKERVTYGGGSRGGAAGRRSASMKLQRIFFAVSSVLSLTLQASATTSESAGGFRALRSIKEVPKGSNATYECSPSGACVPCDYPEKKDMKYRCSETGYRIPLKCVGKAEADAGNSGEKSQSRNLLGGTPKSNGKTYLQKLYTGHK